MVDCPDCGAENPAWARFCVACGSGLAGRCGRCEAPLLPGARFCPRCGAPADAGSGGPELDALPEERRIATILFADLTGFTAASENADPELVKGVVDRGLRRLAAEVESHGGRIDKYIGDNVMGVFGAPEAHEDDPERAVRAGLAMQAAMADVNAQAPGTPDFSLRVGINTGEVMAGKIGDAYTVIGSAVNVAARLQETCSPGAVLVGAGTWRRTRDCIAYRTREVINLRGLSRPTAAFEATGSKAHQGRSRVPARTPLVGRTREIQVLRTLVAGASDDGHPHLATVLGPPGIGKTRLFNELVATLERAESPTRVFTGHCPAYGLGASYWPFREVIGSAFGIDPATPGDGSPSTIQRLAEELGRLVPQTVPAPEESPELIASRLAALLGLEEAPRQTVAEDDEDPATVRNQLFSAVRAAMEAAASEGPVVVGVEDLQWADEGTLELIDYLTRWAHAPIVLVCMAREELIDRRPDWGGGRRRAATVRLDPLDEGGATELVTALLGKAGRGELIPRLVSRCEGNPLFAEEMAGRVLQEGPQAISELPDTVQAVLDTRLDSLAGGERRLIHHAAVVGERFWDSSLDEYAAERGIDLRGALERLVELDLIDPSSTSRLPGSQEFRFRHALIQEVAYSRLPKAQRAHKHAEVASFLERHGEGMVEMTARQFAAALRAGQEAQLDEEFLAATAESARHSLEAAGDAAATVHANSAAEEHYETALETGGASADERARLLEKLGDVLLRGGRAAEAAESWTTCLRLTEDAGLTAGQTARLHRKLSAAEHQRGDRQAAIDHVRTGIDQLRGEHEASLELAKLYGDAAALYMGTGENLLAIYAAEKSLSLADLLGDPASASRAYSTFGRVFGRIGDEDKARLNLELAVERARESEAADVVRALLILGSHLEAAEQDLGRAAGAYEEGLELARRIGSVPEQIELQGGIARLALRRGDRPRVQRATEEGEELAARAGLVGLGCYSRLTRGWLQWCAADGDATRSLREAEELARQVGRMDVVFQALMLQGWVLFAAGEYPAADGAFSGALAVCERTGLLAQSVEVSAARAISLARDGSSPEVAQRNAIEAGATAGRLSVIPASTAALEARGATDPDPVAGAGALREATESWTALERPLATARAKTLYGWRLAEHDQSAGLAALREASEHSAALGIVPLARDAERLAEASAGLPGQD